MIFFMIFLGFTIALLRIASNASEARRKAKKPSRTVQVHKFARRPR